MEPLQIPDRAQVAAEIGTSDQYLYQIETRRRLASRLMARAIETATNGRVSRHELRPDLYPLEAIGGSSNTSVALAVPAPEDGYRGSGVPDGPPPCDEAASESTA